MSVIRGVVQGLAALAIVVLALTLRAVAVVLFGRERDA